MFRPATDQPSDGEVRETFQKHHQYWRSQTGVNANMQSGTEDKVTQQYAGRTPFELLQNALDRCLGSVWLEVVDVGPHGTLVVGNDGQGVTVSPDFDPRKDIAWNKDNQLHSDFHALCGVNLSNKNPDESTGNKGVGFRSVFELGATVQVWSRLLGDRWWGMELHRRMTLASWQGRLTDPRVRDGLAQLLPQTAPWVDATHTLPSFYAPLPLRGESPIPGVPQLMLPTTKTAVVVAIRDAEARRGLEAGLDALAARHLDFVGLRERKRGVVVSLPGGRHALTTWPDPKSGTLLVQHRFPDGGRVAGLAGEAGLAATRVAVAVRWSATAPESNEPTRVYCYLPTQARGAFGADIHGDFQLGIDRKMINVVDGVLKGYHEPLLTAVAELQVGMLLRAGGFTDAEVAAWPGMGGAAVGQVLAGEQGMRDDVWRFAKPAGDDLGPVKKRVEELLFDRGVSDQKPQFWARWAQMAARFFGALTASDGDGANGPRTRRTRRTRAAHEDFWAATEAWLKHRQQAYKREVLKNQRGVLRALLQALHETKCLVIPVLGGGESPAHLCPATVVPVWREDREAKSASEMVLFMRRPGMDDRVMPSLPESLRRHGVVVTTWSPGEALRPVDGLFPGARAFTPPELLHELRQLPRQHDRTWSPEGRLGGASNNEEAEQAQRELLVYAARLFSAGYGQNSALSLSNAKHAYPLGWRARGDAASETTEAAGRAVATLFMRRHDGRWAPARQLQRNELHVDMVRLLDDALGAEPLRERFLDFLGVSRSGGLRVVEGGASGVVIPVAAPPPLIRRSLDHERALSLVLHADDAELGAAADDILRAWGSEAAPGELRWLTEDALRGDGNSGNGCLVKQQLTHSTWLPVGAGRISPPGNLRSPSEFVAPYGLLLNETAGEHRLARVLWSWINAPASDLLERLGAVSRVDAIDVGIARFWIATLQDRLDLQRLLVGEPADRVALLRAWQVVVNVVGCKEGRLSAALAYETVPVADGETLGRPLGERPLRWCDPQDAWVAAEPRCQTALARHFPNIRLATATLSAQSVDSGPFAGQAINYTTLVRHEVELSHGDALAAQVARRLVECLPHLLALADLSTLLSRAVSSLVDLHLRRTLLLDGRVRRAGDVFLDHVLTSGPTSDRQGLPWRKGEFDDVFIEGEPKTRSATIWFDVIGADTPPPLRNFGEALARFMGLGEVAEAWSLALSEVEGDSVEQGSARLDAFLKRKGGSVQSLGRYRLLLCPHTEAELTCLAAAVAGGLAAEGLAPTRQLPPGVTLLGVDDVSVIPAAPHGNPSQASVRTAMEAALGDRRLVQSLPRVDFQLSHQAAWAKWLGVERSSRKTRLLRWVQLARGEEDIDEIETLASTRARRLELAHAPASERLGFDTETAARAWLREEVADLVVTLPAAPLDTWLPELRRYKPVNSAPRVVATAPIPMALPSGDAKALVPQTEAARVEDRLQTAERGEDAELALLSWVVANTQGLLDAEPLGWEILSAAAKESKSVHQAIERCRSAGRIDGEALHVSKSWGNAGYDLLGLEWTKEGLRVVRYEVKGLPLTGTRLRFFLSRNEHGVARRCRRDGTMWRLIGVREGGTTAKGAAALDLTGVVQELLDEEGSLDSLGRAGIIPDGYVVYREIPS